MTAADSIAIAPVLAALATAVLSLVVRRRRRVQRVVSLGGVLAYATAVGALVWRVVLAPDAASAAYQLAGWRAPFGITLVADGLSAFMLAIVAVVGVAALAFSVRYVDARNQRVFYHPLFHFLLLGVSGAFLTGDLFNLFVWFEVLLMASYVFVVFYGGPQHTRATLRYVVLNVVASAVMLLAVGGLYATTGTLNMADMARRLAAPGAFGVQVGPVVGLSMLLLTVFGLKAGLVPFQFWVPGAYKAAPLPIAAMLAGATKKVGIYAIVRLYFTVFSAAEVSIQLPGFAGNSPLAVLGPVLLLMAAASIFVGGVGAIYAGSIEGMLAYSSIGQVGFIAVPIAVGATAATIEGRTLAILAALIYALNHSLAKGLLFLAAGAVRSTTGTTTFAELGGLSSRTPVLSGAFFVGALSLVGIPPLSGFFGKFLVFDTLARADAAAAVGVLLVGSVLTIVYTTRAWNGAFWGERTPPVDHGRSDPLQVAVLAALAAAIVLVGIGFDPVYEFAEAAATAATDTEAYVDLVLEGGESP